MSWSESLRGDSIARLLDTDSPDVRYLVLRDLLDRPHDDPKLQTVRRMAHQTGAIATVLSKMDPAGYWEQPGAGYNPKYRSTVWSIILLAHLGAEVGEDQRIATACAYLLDHALTRYGQFSGSGAPSGTVDCLQGNMVWSLMEMGCVDPRLDAAFDWIARSITGEGVAPASDRQAELRYYAGKCGPNFACGANNKLACAWGCVKVMLALGKLPVEQRTPLINQAIQAGVDFLLAVDPAQAEYPTGYSDHPSRNWWKFGFPVFYVTDILQIAEALVSLGYGSDPRLKPALTLIWEKQDAMGRWALEYDYRGKTWLDFGELKKPNPWVTLRALKLFKTLGNVV